MAAPSPRPPVSVAPRYGRLCKTPPIPPTTVPRPSSMFSNTWPPLARIGSVQDAVSVAVTLLVLSGITTSSKPTVQGRTSPEKRQFVNPTDTQDLTIKSKLNPPEPQFEPRQPVLELSRNASFW